MLHSRSRIEWLIHFGVQRNECRGTGVLSRFTLVTCDLATYASRDGTFGNVATHIYARHTMIVPAYYTTAFTFHAPAAIYKFTVALLRRGKHNTSQ